MKHISEEELIEQYYSRITSGAARHFEDCAECVVAYAELANDLDEMEFAEPPARDASYGARVWESIAGSLPAYEKRKRNWLGIGAMRGLSYAATCALLVVGAFYAGRIWEQKHQPTAARANPPQAQQPAGHPQERVVVVVLSDHLDRSERLLVELKHADANSAETISPLRDQARGLLAANRICRQNATKIDDPALASALDRLDHVLGELASQPEGLNSAAITQLQNEMNAEGLLFEVRVLRSRIPEGQTGEKRRSEGDSI
jgi:hypothetical protein